MFKKSNLIEWISLLGLLLYFTGYAQESKTAEELRVQVLIQKATELYQARKYQEAILIVEEVLQILEKLRGSEHPDVATWLNNLAELYRAQGRYRDAETLHKRALAIREKALGAEHPDVANSLNNLALLYQDQGRYGEAEPLYQRALSIFEKILGSEHQYVATSLNNLAECYRIQGKYAEAEPLSQRALSIFEKILGSEHQYVATSLNNLAALYRAQGKYADAEPLYRRALAIFEIALGSEHPDVAPNLNNLAELYETQGKYADAEPLYRRALTIDEKALGQEHPYVAIDLNNLAGLYQIQGNYAKAEPLHKRALAIREKVLGPEHPDVATSLNNLANLYGDQGKYADAESFCQRALAIREKALGHNHPDVSTSLNNLAELYRRQGKYVDAELLYRRALAIDEKVLGPEHEYVAISLHNLALLYKTQDKYTDAELLCLRALAIFKKALGGGHPDVAKSLINLADLYWSQDRYGEAESFFDRANVNFLQQINTYFPAMSEKEREQFYQTINFNFEFFNSFASERIRENPAISADAYNNQLAVKALLLNSTAKVKRQILSSGDSDLINLYRKWIDQKEYLAKVYTLSKAEIAQQRINKDSLEALANNLEKELSRRSETFAKAADTTLYTWWNIQQALSPGEAAVEIVRFRWYNKTWTDTIYYAALIVTPETKDCPEMVLLENGNDLEDTHFVDYLENREGIRTPVAYQNYWQPIGEKLTGIKKVYFSPDGIYNQINLNILFNPETGGYLIDDIDIQLVTNTKDILAFGRQPGSKQPAALFGRPRYDLSKEQYENLAARHRGETFEGNLRSDQEQSFLAGVTWRDLPGSGEEVKKVEAVLKKHGWQSHLYLDTLALEEAVKKVDNPAILHLATHGFFIPTEEIYSDDFRILRVILMGDEQPAAYQINPMLRSGVVLAGATSYKNAAEKPKTEDGILTAYEAANLDLDRTELVVLSACETGLGEVKYGEGVYGLQRAFKVSGAKTILISLWKVDDAITQELMVAFYDTWLQSGKKRAAFRSAQEMIRKNHNQPRYWGAFVMVGE